MYQTKIKESIQKLEELKLELEHKFVTAETDRMYFNVKLREVELFIISLKNMLLLAS